VSQQTVSRWEKGQSRPRGVVVAKLAAALNLSVDDVMAAMDAPTEPQRPQAEDVPLPVRPLVPVLPLNSLSADNFERFMTELLQRRFPDAEVSQLGGQGDDQRGFDILIVHSDGRRGAVQCKREQQFGPKKLAKAIAAAELDVAEPIIALARAATADARFEMEKHAGWLLWDQADLSRQVRQLPPESALYLVRTYFPSHVEPFLGVRPASPWMAVDEFYRSTSFTLLNHRQPLVGRGQTVEEIVAWAVDPDASNVAVLVGRGGLGKSKLLREVATRSYATELHFRFLAVDQAPTPNDFDSLPRTGDLVVVIDDAHGVDGVAGIAAQLWMQRPRAKLLLATRPYGETMLDAEVWKLNQSPRALQRWKLEDLSQTEACNLVSRLTDRSIFDPLTRQLASISADCPFVALVAADLLNRGELSGTTLASDVALRADVLRRFAELATTYGSGRDAAERREVLAALAAFQPVRLSDRAFATAVTALTRIESWDIVNGRIRELEDVGLILRRGDAVRLVPDILGDILLGQAAYDDRSDRATAFLPRAQDAATGAPLQHLLVNASRMDWQIRDGTATRTNMVGDLWATLRAEILNGSVDQQLPLLSLVAKIAYYQPKVALALVEDVLALDSREPPTPADVTSSASSRQAVVRATTPILRNVAYHLDHLRPALDLLWSLAQDDQRPTNQHPDHPLRVLMQLADLQTGKPFKYIHTVIDAATEWLARPAKLSPFDVIEPILAVEGNDEVHADLTLTFRSFPLDPNSVRDVRSRVIDLAVREARSEDIPSAVRAVEALAHAIRGPGRFQRQPSDAEMQDWAREFIPVIETLGEIGAEPNHDPAVRIAIRKAIGWHAEHSTSETKAAAIAALSVLVTSPDDALALCLHDGWGQLAMRTERNFEEAERARIAEFQRVAKEITTGCTDDEVLALLEGRLHIERTALDGINSSGRFLWELFDFRPSAAVRLCEEAIAGRLPELSQFVALAVAVLANRGDPSAIQFAAALASGDSARRQNAALALSWNRGTRSGLLPGEFDLLAQFAGHDDEHVRAAMGRAVYLIALSDRAVALDLLVKIEFAQSGKVAAEALSCLAPPGPLDWSGTDAALRESILAQLTMCKSIDEYELMSAIGELSRIDPLRVTRFLIARIDRQATRQELGYDALPHRWDPPLKVKETGTFARCLIEVREWMTCVGHDRRSYYRHDDGAELYALMADDWNDQALAVLADIGDASSEATLMTAARILAHAPSQVLLQNVALVAKVLRRAEALGQDEAKLIFHALLPTNRGAFASWSFERPVKDEQERNRAREIATDLPRGSIESRFFHTLADAVEARLNWTMERAEPRFDGRDW